MTYKDLLAQLQCLSETQLQHEVFVKWEHGIEFYPVIETKLGTGEKKSLYVSHIYFVI